MIEAFAAIKGSASSGALPTNCSKRWTLRHRVQKTRIQPEVSLAESTNLFKYSAGAAAEMDRQARFSAVTRSSLGAG